MDEQKNSHSTIRRAHREPGRRYAVGSVRPRAGRDIVSVSQSSMSHRPQPKPTPPESSSPQKHLDIKAPHTRTRSTTKPALPRQKRSMVLRRQMVERAEQYKEQARLIHRRHIFRHLLTASVLMSVGIVAWSFQGLLPFSINWFEQSAPSSTVTSIQPHNETAPLDETVVTSEDINSHLMSADEPRIVRIPRINVESRIKRVGKALNGEPISPSNIYDVGWFEASGKPGAEGAVLLNGHTVGPTMNGVLYSLGDLVLNDKILLERGDGAIISYTVHKLQTYSYNEIDMSVATRSIDTAKHGLNIMTAPARYDGTPDMAKKRLIVFAVEDNAAR